MKRNDEINSLYEFVPTRPIHSKEFTFTPNTQVLPLIQLYGY